MNIDAGMSEDEYNNFGMEGFEEAGQFDNELIAADARSICPGCLKPCSRLQNYCANCDSNEVINPLASYMPFVRLRFECGFYGKMWRKIWYDKEASIMFKLVCLFLTTAFAPVLLIAGLPLLLIGKIQEPNLLKITTAGFYVIAVVVLMIFIYLAVFRGAFSQFPIG